VIALDKDGGSAGNQIRDIYLRHAVRLVKYSAFEAERLVSILDAANTQIKALINKAKSIDTKKQYARVARQIKQITKQLNEQLYGQLHLDFEELAAEETAFVEKSLKTIGVTAELGLVNISPQRIWAAAGFASYAENGHETFKSYLDGLSDNLYKVWDTQVRSGYIAGLTAQQINRNVLGSVKDMEPGQMQALRNSLERHTRTMVSFLAETARDAVYRENESLFDGYKYLATLDTRTCLVCGADDGKVFKNLDEAPKLPRHLNDRCLYVPYIKGFEDIPGERAAMDGPVSDKTTYADWLKEQPASIQREIMGPTRYAAYKNGVPVNGFVSDGRKLTLEQLKKTEYGDKIPDRPAPSAVIYHPVDAKTQTEFQSVAQQLYDAAPADQRNALLNYTRSGFYDMNDMLYGNQSFEGDKKTKLDISVQNLDTLIRGYRLDRDIITYRGTEAKYYSGWETGKSYRSPAFISTTIDKDNELVKYNEMRIEMRIRKGTNGMYVGDLSAHEKENEFLLGRGLNYKVIEKTGNSMLLEVSND
jgi:hypothetical protein